jgi:hypothetical protein
MSFSFNVTGKTREDANAQVAAKLEEIVAAQDSHEVDADAVTETVDMYLDLIEHNDGETISVSVSGSVGWENVTEEGVARRRYTGAGVNVSVRSYKES